MKKIAFLPVLFSLLFLAACSDSDVQPENLALSVVGTHSGYTMASSAYFADMLATDQEVIITSTEADKVNISFVSDTWGTTTIIGAELGGTKDAVKISGSGKSELAHAGNAAQEYPCTVEGSMVGKDLQLKFSCPGVMGGLTIVFSNGTAPVAE